MKKILLISILTAGTFLVKAQELGIQFGQSISNFQFEDSQGTELQGLQKTDNFFMTLDYRQPIFLKTFKQRMFMDVGFGYNRYGSSGSDAILDNYYTWDVTYIGLNLGVDYVFFRNRNILFYGKALASPEMLIHGTQTLNNDVYNLSGEEDFDTPIIFFRVGMGAQFEISDEASAFIQYMGGKSFDFSGNAETLHIVSHNFGCGILFNLIKDPYKTEWKGDDRRP